MIKKYKQFITEEVDYDDILKSMRDQGWGDISPQWFEYFEDSSRYNNEKNTKEYLITFSNYMDDVESGTIGEDGEDIE